MGGDKPLGLVVGAVVVGFLVGLPAAIVPAYYTFANVYAIVTGSDFSSDTMNVGVFLTGMALTVALYLVAMAVIAGLIGRALSPKRKRGQEAG